METLVPDVEATEESVVALGVFDGVHLGHRELLAEAARARQSLGLPLLVMTFAPHPRTLTGGPNGYDRLLTPLVEKSALLRDAGADYLLVMPFTPELAATAPRRFAEVHLFGRYKARHVVCGFNFTFGHRGAGTPRDLTTWGQELGFTVSVVAPFEVTGETVSSTRIRSALASGDARDAMLCLGRPYPLTGRVSPGDGRGTKIGIPTSNLSLPDDKFLPGNGVYAAFVRIADGGKDALTARPAVANIGTRPTFAGDGVRVEVHIPGFSGDLYGRRMQVLIIERLRDERKFDDAAALRAQVERDAGRALAFCGKAGSFTLPKAYDRMLASNLP